MRNFAFATLAAVALAASDMEGTPAMFPTAAVGVVTSDGMVNELVRTQDDGTKAAVIYVGWTTTCSDCAFAQGAIVSNYVQWEDVANPGMMAGMTCNAAWGKSNSY